MHAESSKLVNPTESAKNVLSLCHQEGFILPPDMTHLFSKKLHTYGSTPENITPRYDWTYDTHEWRVKGKCVLE